MKRIKKNNPKIIVFDEGGGYNEEISFKQIYKNGEFVDKEKGMALNSVLKSIAHILGDELHVAPIIYALKNSSGCDMMIKNISEDQNLSRSPVSKLFGVHDIHGGRSRSTDELEITDEYLEDLVKQGRFTYGGKIVTNPEQRKRAINWIKKLKNIGKEAGQELYQEIQETR